MLHKRQDKHFIFRSLKDSSNSRKTFPFIHHQSSNAHVPKAPHRRLRQDTPTALGVGRASIRIPLLVDKPIVRSPCPSEFNERLRADSARTINCSPKSNSSLPSLYCDEQVQRLSKKRVYTSTTREATEEAALPTPRRIVPHSTLEREADPVRYRAIRYSPRPSLWQQYAREWDAMQLRMSSDAESPNDLTLPEIGKSFFSSLMKTNGTTENLDEVESKELVFFRPMPGYGGFVPRHAVEHSSHKSTDCVTDCMCSTARRTYRTFTVDEYKLLEHARKGPFSKTVTMTHPLNPFNKVEHKTHSY